LKLQEEGTRVKEAYQRDSRPIEVPEGSLMLSKRDILSSLSAYLDRVPFSKVSEGTEADFAYPADITEHADRLTVELYDGSSFDIAVGNIKYK
jgi:hypothetical protein